MAKRSKRKRRDQPKPRTGGSPKDRDAAELQAALSRSQRPREDPAGVLARLQVNPPRVVGHASAETAKLLD